MHPSLPPQASRPSLLDQSLLVKRYQNSARRLFLFDYDGTLTPIVQHPSLARPSFRLLSALERLASADGNFVWIISGRDQAFLDASLGHISCLGISAEHGNFSKFPGSTQWDNASASLNMDWQNEAIGIFNRFVKETPGSFVEQKKVAITWHYRRSDTELGSQQAIKCYNELRSQLADKWDLHVSSGKANVEVRPSTASKGGIATRLIFPPAKAKDRQDADFIFCAGDDSTDEDMFAILHSPSLLHDKTAAFACFIGPESKPTLADCCLAEPEDLISVIEKLGNTRAQDLSQKPST